MATRAFRKSMLVSLGLLLIGACDTGQQETSAIPVETQSGNTGENMQQVTGSVSYRERIMLRPGSTVEVTLLDTSKADVVAVELARQTIPNPGPPPIPFVLEYDAAQIDERLSYNVRATIRHGDQLVFTTDRHYPVLTRGAGSSVELMLVRVASGPANRRVASLTGTHWKLVSIGAEEYRYAGQQREPHLNLAADGSIASGSTGCNTFSGSFESEGATLTMGSLAVTQIACIEGMETERAFLDALNATNRYEITANTMQLFADDTPVLGFEAVNF